MIQRTKIRRISAKRLAELGGKMPFSTIRPRTKFPQKGKKRIKHAYLKERTGASYYRKTVVTRRNLAKHSAAGLQPKSSRRVNQRRERPELFFQREKQETWPEISLRMRLKWWDEADSEPLLCGICGEEIFHFHDLVPDHIVPGKMGGCKDHSESNLQPAHSLCNLEKGSKRNFRKNAA